MALLGAALLGWGAPVGAAGLVVERLDLGEGPGEQVYKLQEQGDLRVFARSASNFQQVRLQLQRRIAGQWQPAQDLPAGDPRWQDGAWTARLPVNEGVRSNDFTLTPDGRYVLWWSGNADLDGGDLYLAERLGDAHGPALRLPAPVNGPAFEFTPSISADGEWMYFASTRGDAQGLSHVYRVSWPQVLAQLGAAASAHSQAALDQAVSALWHAIGHAPGQASDVQALRRLLHPDARVFGQSIKASSLQLWVASAEQFLAEMGRPSDKGLYECEVERQQRRFGGHAQVYSVVQTRRDPAQAGPSYTGVNSMHWQLGPQGWQLLSLHYALESPGLRLPSAAAVCLG
ncbi:hypothetical protein J2X21_004588 [Kinneretia asaccharophila]|uniref:DUF4440 domain-containing protein n=2 Tax=Roseateles asaccharophilus TaxID=582607 RepID=A0ABU2ADZ2_9BURK|nr:hypothetical protein [Roseateles asaccharophilus]